MGKLSKRKKSLISFLESWCVAISSNAFIASAVQMTRGSAGIRVKFAKEKLTF